MSELPVSPECESARPELSAYVDGELPAGETAAIERHLAGCAACRAEVTLLRVVTRSLRLAARPEPSEAMRQRLLAQVRAELPPQRIELLCIERHGDQVMRRREVLMYREPALPPRPAPITARPSGSVIQQYRWERSGSAHCHQMIASHYGRDFDERRA